MTDHTQNHDEIAPKRPMVYVRRLREDELPDGAPAGGLFAIHDQSGVRIGIAPKRDQAFIAARQHDLNPVSVH